MKLGLQILVASPGGASLVIAQRVSSALTCTSRESCTHHAQRNWLVIPHRSYSIQTTKMVKPKAIPSMQPFYRKIKIAQPFLWPKVDSPFDYA